MGLTQSIGLCRGAHRVTHLASARIVGLFFSRVPPIQNGATYQKAMLHFCFSVDQYGIRGECWQIIVISAPECTSSMYDYTSSSVRPLELTTITTVLLESYNDFMNYPFLKYTVVCILAKWTCKNEG
jgi:hypothetical protein